MTQLSTLTGVPRKAPGTRRGRMERLNIEVYPEESALLRRAKAAASLRGMTFREWVIDALREQVERDGAVDAR